jgi:hypothetical protein
VTNGRLWPVFSIRWAYNPLATVRFEQLPRFAGASLARYIPLNHTQAHPPPARLEEMGRCAVAQALALASDPDFRRMVERYGQVMIGGLVQGPIPRLARHHGPDSERCQHRRWSQRPAAHVEHHELDQ